MKSVSDSSLTNRTYINRRLISFMTGVNVTLLPCRITKSVVDYIGAIRKATVGYQYRYRCLVGRMAMHACQIGPTDTTPPCPRSPQRVCVETKPISACDRSFTYCTYVIDKRFSYTTGVKVSYLCQLWTKLVVDYIGAICKATVWHRYRYARVAFIYRTYVIDERFRYTTGVKVSYLCQSWTKLVVDYVGAICKATAGYQYWYARVDFTYRTYVIDEWFCYATDVKVSYLCQSWMKLVIDYVGVMRKATVGYRYRYRQ